MRRGEGGEKVGGKKLMEERGEGESVGRRAGRKRERKKEGEGEVFGHLIGTVRFKSMPQPLTLTYLSHT